MSSRDILERHDDLDGPDEPAPDDLDALDDDYRAPAMPVLPWSLLVGGGIAFVAAFTLLIERIHLLEDSSYTPSCSINPVLSCGSVMVTDQASVFGFPNPIIGVAAFAGLMAIGAAMLAGARFAPWFWAGLQLGVILGVGFVHWLIWQSLYDIGALCPYCMVVWVMVVPMFLYVTRRNVAVLAERRGGRGGAAKVFVDYHALWLILWFLVVISLIGVRFWDYWRTLI